MRTLFALGNGRQCDLRNPRPDDVDFKEMAEHLAKEARYNGSTPGVFYSVAEHCVRGARAIVRQVGDYNLAAYFLLHDGHEYVLKDDTTPKKAAIAQEAHERFGVLAEHIIAAFGSITERHDAAIYQAAGLEWPCSDAIAASIKKWDLVMLVTEWRDLMKGREHPNWSAYSQITPLREVIKPWPWEVAQSRFYEECRILLPCFKVPQ